MKVDELKKIIKESIREVLKENDVIKELVSESINTSINTVFKVILENKHLLGTKEVIKEVVHSPSFEQPTQKPSTTSDDEAIRKFRAQVMKGQSAKIQESSFANLNVPSPQQVINEQSKVQKPIEQRQKVQTNNNSKPNYLAMISSAELDDEEWIDQDLKLI